MKSQQVHSSVVGTPGVPRRSRHPRLPRSQRCINALGAWGYFFGAVQWLVTFGLYFMWLNTYFIVPMQPSAQPVAPAAPVSSPAVQGETPLFVYIGGALLVLLMMSIAVYAVWKFPRMVSRAGRAAVQTIAEQATPIALKVRHIPETKKNRRLMGVRLTIGVKILMILLPVGLAWLTVVMKEQVLEMHLAVGLSAGIAAVTLFFFLLQYVCALLLKVPLAKLR